jgi:hypothetical protein
MNRAAQKRRVEEMIAHHDQSITYKECVKLLQEEINNLEPISSLPPEILGTVFPFVLDGWTRTSANFPFPLYYFTQVSRL